MANSVLCFLGSLRVLVYKAQEEVGETSKKPVGPCILSPRGGYPRDIEGPCMKPKRRLCGKPYFVSKQWVRSFHIGVCFFGWMFPMFGTMAF